MGRNGNLALALGVLAVALLAASGKLGELWRAIMSSPTAAGTPPGGVTSPPSVGDFGGPGSITGPPSVGDFGPTIGGVGTGASAGAAAIIAAITGKKGASNTTIYAGANPALDDVFARWPAGHQQEWNAFLTCFASTGSVDACARQGLVLSTEGRG